MNRRLCNALLLPLLPLLATIACAAPRPMLRVWGCQHHAQCRQFLTDFHADREFRDALEARFDVRFCDVHGIAGCGLAAKVNGITACPTFDPCDRVGRLEGYRGKAELLQALGLKRPPPLLQDTPSQPASPADTANPDDASSAAAPDPLAAVRQELQALQADAAARHQSTEQLRAQMLDAIGRQSLTLDQVQRALAGNQQSNELARLRDAIAQVQAELQTRHAPPVASPAPLPPSGSLSAAADDRGPAARPLLQIGRLALTAGELAAAVGITFASGGTGALAWTAGSALLGLLRRRRQRRAQGASSPPASGPAPESAPTSATPAVAAPFTPTNFAPYPVDRISAAYTYAKRELSQKYPGSVSAIETLDALMQQHLSGQQAAASSR